MKKTLFAVILSIPCLCAQSDIQCDRVGGAILTNFLNQTTTLGVATRDLAGGLGVDVLGVTSGPNGATVFEL